MNEIEIAIVNIMKVLYKIDENHEKALIKSFKETSQDDKKNIAKILINAFKQREKSLKTLTSKIKKMNIEIDEIIDYKDAENILSKLF